MTGICKPLLLTFSCHFFVPITYRYINIITTYLITCLKKIMLKSAYKVYLYEFYSVSWSFTRIWYNYSP